MDEEAESFFGRTCRLRPRDLAASRERLDAFVAEQVRDGRRCALVTSGGTSVPLEINTVRFVDNFSTGTRGAVCTEELLGSGYAVVLLYRLGSAVPFLSGLYAELRQDPVELLKGLGAGAQLVAPPLELQCGPGSLTAASGHVPQPLHLLALPFTTIFEYLFLLRESCQSLERAGRGALLLLAAAVSDFYLPEEDMAVEKIQSRAADGLHIHLRNVPKLLGAVRSWAPDALLVSFKLETNANILDAKAAGAICKYGVDAVCANLLHSYREWVNLLQRDPHSSRIELPTQDVTGAEKEPLVVRGLLCERIEKGQCDASTDRPLARAVVRLHEAHVSRASSEHASKRLRTDT
ncbi:unnamed protein product [Prorocentrum cordatum]|uniref:DNA/pantothenate metabolism flavoprotein C-terminal domain-containing protein n=1 Tax=Prorocentrum cordatum TaxID=2364126 RepID=A0ABN9RW74_9DINO|nr:unnamed protein product [Polarella glacialis]